MSIHSDDLSTGAGCDGADAAVWVGGRAVPGVPVGAESDDRVESGRVGSGGRGESARVRCRREQARVKRLEWIAREVAGAPRLPVDVVEYLALLLGDPPTPDGGGDGDGGHRG